MFDDPRPDLFGCLLEVASVAEPVAQLAERLRPFELRELDPLRRKLFQEMLPDEVFPKIEYGCGLVGARVGFSLRVEVSRAEL